jgi:predicted HicB family RNase H-like nuclease
MNYKGYSALFAYDDDEEVYYGQVDGIRDVVTFVAPTVAELEQEFRISVDEYLAFCAERGVAAERPNQERIRAAS